MRGRRRFCRPSRRFTARWRDRRRRIKLPFRICISGSAPLPVQVLKDFEAKFGIPLIEGYGLSEASPVVALNPILGVRKPGSIGRADSERGGERAG